MPGGRPRLYTYANDDERRAGERARRKARYASDPEHRVAVLTRNSSWAKANRVDTPEQKANDAIVRRALRQTPEHKKAHAAYEAQRRAAMLPEEREALREKNTAWSDTNREYLNAAERARRAAMTPAQKSALWAQMHNSRTRIAGSMTEAVVTIVLKASQCHYCEVPISRELPRYHPRRATIDHKIPLTKDGTHAIHNLVAACRRCNSKKSSRDYDEFVSSISHSCAA